MRLNLLIIPIFIALLPLTQAATLIVSSKEGDYDYSRIQDAIDNATSGDTVLVYGGTYQENLNVTKPLTLRGMMCPVVSGSFGGSTITINADGVILEGFEVKYSERCGKKYKDPLEPETGIRVNSKDNIIRFNYVCFSCCGIFVRDSSNNSVNHNEVKSNDKYGIYLQNSSDNKIDCNEANSNKYGIYLLNSSDNVINGNIAESNKRDGIHLQNSSKNVINASNVAKSNEYYGIHLKYSLRNNVSGNKVRVHEASPEQRSGIYLYGSLGNQISNNEIVKNDENGILLESNSNDNNISNNSVINGHCGISLNDGCKNNIIIGNTAKSNENYGIYLWGCSNNNTIENNTALGCHDAGIRIMQNNIGNQIYGNNFSSCEGGHDAIDNDGENLWACNYYGRYDCTDSDGNNICDEEYKIRGSDTVDKYPLAKKLSLQRM